MIYKLEIGSTEGTIEAGSVEEARETLRGLLRQIGMDLAEYYAWEGDAKVGTDSWHIVCGGHQPSVEITER